MVDPFQVLPGITEKTILVTKEVNSVGRQAKGQFSYPTYGTGVVVGTSAWPVATRPWLYLMSRWGQSDLTDLHVVVDGSAFFDGADDRREVVVRKNHVCCVLRVADIQEPTRERG